MLNNSKLQTFLAIAPFVFFILALVGYFFIIFSVFMSMEGSNSGNVNPFAVGGFVFFFLFVMFAALLMLVSLIYFLIHAIKNPNLEGNNLRVIWILILFFISGIGPLVYWIAEIRMKDPKPVIPE